MSRKVVVKKGVSKEKLKLIKKISIVEEEGS